MGRRIAEVQAFHLAAPLPEPLGGSARRGPLRARESTIVRIATDDGAVGYGECAGPPAVLVPAVRHLAPVILGADPLARTALAAALMARAREEGPSGLLVAAASGIDIALWDLAAKLMGVPIATLLGGAVRTQVPVYAASVYFSSLDRAVEVAGRLVAGGFDVIKVKVGLGLEDDLRGIRAIREAVGQDVRLLLDANGAYDARTAVALAQQCAPHRILWLEEPVPADDLTGCQFVHRAVSVPIAAGENLHTRYGFAPWLASRAIDVAMPDLGRCGGLTEAAAIAAMASACRIAVSPHCWGSSIALAASVQLAATLRNCEMVEFDAHPSPLREALIADDLVPVAGAITVPDRPGIGVEVREAALHDLAISSD